MRGHGLMQAIARVNRVFRDVRANLRRLVKRILRKHGYPPDKQEKATRTVLEQAEVLSAGWGGLTSPGFGQDPTARANRRKGRGRLG